MIKLEFAVQGPWYQNSTKIAGLLRLFRTLKMARILRKIFAFNLIYSIGTQKLHEARTYHFSFAPLYCRKTNSNIFFFFKIDKLILFILILLNLMAKEERSEEPVDKPFMICTLNVM